MKSGDYEMDREIIVREDDEAEHLHLQSVVASFKHYKIYTFTRISKRSRFISSLPPIHQRRLQKYSEYLNKFKACVEVNERVIELIIRDPDNLFLNIRPPRHRTADPTNIPMLCNPAQSLEQRLQVDKVQSVLRQFVRDWSKEGAEEREQCYKPILDEISTQFPPETYDVECVRVLVPGAGLGRLAWEVARMGYRCEGNDVSIFMLLASRFIINCSKQKELYVLHPWLNDFTNNSSCEQQMASVRVPDELPGSVKLNDFSMVAGDFLELYKEPVWDCVATCFFIDCAQNIIEFAETIHRILRPGGIWINLGPLLYHWSDDMEKDSIEPPYDILMGIIRDIGFIVEKEQTDLRTKYAQNPHSMLQREYRSVYFVCRKQDDGVR